MTDSPEYRRRQQELDEQGRKKRKKEKQAYTHPRWVVGVLLLTVAMLAAVVLYQNVIAPVIANPALKTIWK